MIREATIGLVALTSIIHVEAGLAQSNCLPGLAGCPVSPSHDVATETPNGGWTEKRVLLGEGGYSALDAEPIAIVRYPQRVFPRDAANFTMGASASTVGWGASSRDGGVSFSITVPSYAGGVPWESGASREEVLRKLARPEHEDGVTKRPCVAKDDLTACYSYEHNSFRHEKYGVYNVFAIKESNETGSESERFATDYYLTFTITSKDKADTALIGLAEEVFRKIRITAHKEVLLQRLALGRG